MLDFFLILVNSVPLFKSKEQVSLYLVVTEHAASPGEGRGVGWGAGRTQRAGEISLPTWCNIKPSEHLGPIHFCRQTNQRGKALNPPLPAAAAPRKSKRTINVHFCQHLEFPSTVQREWLKPPTMQCSHHQKPSISSALWSDVPVHEQNRGREKWRKGGDSGKPAGMFLGP